MQHTYSAKLKAYLITLGYRFQHNPSQLIQSWQCLSESGELVSDRATQSGCISAAAKALGGVSDSDLGWV